METFFNALMFFGVFMVVGSSIRDMGENQGGDKMTSKFDIKKA